MAITILHGQELSATTQPQSGTLTVTPNAGTVAGDLVLVVCSVADSASASWSISGGTGTWTTVMNSGSLGTGKFFVFSKTFAAGDTTYTLTRTGSDAWRIVPETIQGWDSAVAPVIGTLGTRAASGGTNTTTAPSITTTANNSVALYISMERTTANDNAPTVNNGFSQVYDAHTIAGDNLQAIYIASKSIPTPGAVGATTATFTNTHASNSGAFLYAVAEKATTGGGGSGATVVAGANGRNTGGSTVTFGLPAGIASGDLLLVGYLAGSSSAPTSDHGTKGWWDLGATAVNSRTWRVYGRIYNPSTPAGDYTLTMNTSAFARWASVAIRNHGVTVSTDIQRGTMWLRGDNGGTQGKVIAPSITTAGANRLVMAFLGEATNATGGYTITNANGFSLVTEGTEDASSIEWISAWQKSMGTAAPSGDFEVTYTPTSLNGIGVQYSIPPAAAGPSPTTGQIGGHAVTYAGETVLNVGAARLNGSSISVVLYNSAGTTELQRKTMTVNATTQWGNVQFTGLTADTIYTVKFEVDGAVQADVQIVRAKTKKPVGVPVSFTAVGGSCQFTASNHPIFRAIAAKNPEFFTHMGDLHYADPTTDSAWRTAVNQSLTATNFQYLTDRVPFSWTWDNHDRIILDAGSSASPLNMGYTDPATNTQWRTFSGEAGDYMVSNAAGRMWRIGRVMFIQTDQWTMKDDPDAVAEPRTFLGAAQKQAFKDALQLANDTPGIALVVWWCSWNTANNANGRWNSFNTETVELENFINARPTLKKKLVMIGGDSHSLNADAGSRSGTGFRFKGVPSLNVSGYNRSSTNGDANVGWDIANGPLITLGTPEQGWGSYSLLNITDNGKELRFRWEARRVHNDGNNTYTEDVVAFFERSYGTDIEAAYMGNTQAQFVSMGNTRLWAREEKGSDYTPSSTA